MTAPSPEAPEQGEKSAAVVGWTTVKMRSLSEMRAHPGVEHVDDERHIGNGIIVTLIEGVFFYDDCGVKGFDTVREALADTKAALLSAGVSS